MCRQMRLLVLLLIVVLPTRVADPGVHAQTSDERSSFEVASVKPNVTGSIVVNQKVERGRYIGTNMSLMDLVAVTYSPIPRSRIVGGPNWVTTDRFDILAKIEGSPSGPQIVAMLRSLLSERFALHAHTEQREGVIYELLAKDTGPLGPGLSHSTANCRPLDGSQPPSERQDVAPCPGGTFPGQIRATAVTMATFAKMLSPWLDQREVRDRTNLTGLFDVHLTFTPDRLPRLPDNGPDDLIAAIQAIDPNGPSLLTAVQEQLGLKLNPTKAKIEFLVIDDANRPTPN